MPPIHSKPRSMETSNDSDTIESENMPTLSIDLSEIISNAVTKYKSSDTIESENTPTLSIDLSEIISNAVTKYKSSDTIGSENMPTLSIDLSEIISNAVTKYKSSDTIESENTPTLSIDLSEIISNAVTKYKSSDTIENENTPTLSIDLSEIISSAVTKFKSSTPKNNKRKIKFKFPCSICEKSVNKNQKSVYCNNCDLWVHKKCEGLLDDEFQKLVEEDDEVPWFCLVCQIKLNAEIFLFGVLSKFELLDLYGIDLPSHLQTLPSFETRSKLENLPHMK